MIRNDFVSNSSSSSFIVTSSDNIYDCLFQDYNVIDLKQYVDHYLKDDCFGYMTFYDQKLNTFDFLLDNVYCAKFAHGLYRLLPNTCKDDLKMYLDYYSKKPDYNRNLTEYMDWSKGLDKIMDLIKDKVYHSLCLTWSDVKFHVCTTSDSYIEEEREDGVCNMEELIEERLNYIDSLKPLKFKRIYSHH